MESMFYHIRCFFLEAITYELLGLVIKRNSNIVFLFE
jgi:hypothetical protein